MNLKDYIESYFKDLKGYYFELGVIEQNTGRKQTTQIGVTNAQLMFIHENGSPARNIPQRPVLAMTIEWAKSGFLNDEYNNAIDKYFNSGFDLSVFEQSLKQTAIRIENYARDIIYSNDGRLKENAPSVIKKKNGNHPLFDTGQLARSITCRLCKDGAEV